MRNIFEPLTRVELVTPSLPRKCSTTELQRLVLSKMTSGLQLLAAFALITFRLWSGRRGSNPPPIAWKAIALPNELLPQAWWGRVDSNHRTLPRTDLQSVAIATMRLPHCYPDAFPKVSPGAFRADEGTRTPDRLITNQLLYQLSYIGFPALSNNSFLLN